jgi:hypothetical protein
VGGTSEDLRYLKSISLHLWLFGYELPGELLLLLLLPCMLQPLPCCALERWHYVHLYILQAAIWVAGAETMFSSCPADTIMVFTDAALHILTSSKKGEEQTAMNKQLQQLIAAGCIGFYVQLPKRVA